MRLNRFIVEKEIENNSPLVIDDKVIVNQINKVLRLSVGDNIVILNGSGNEWQCQIESKDKNNIYVFVKNSISPNREPKRKVTLYLSILKKENFEIAVQKAVELGVFRVVPIVSERTVKQNIKMDRLKIIIREAVEQSGRVFIPEISEIQEFKLALKNAFDENDIILFADTDDSDSSNLDYPDDKVLSIFIGPEGGWSQKERDLARDMKLELISLSNLTLRAETAAIVAVAKLVGC